MPSWCSLPRPAQPTSSPVAARSRRASWKESSQSRVPFPSRRAPPSGFPWVSARTSRQRCGTGTSTSSTDSTRLSRARLRGPPRGRDDECRHLRRPGAARLPAPQESARPPARSDRGSWRPARTSPTALPRGSPARTPSSRPGSTSSSSRPPRRNRPDRGRDRGREPARGPGRAPCAPRPRRLGGDPPAHRADSAARSWSIPLGLRDVYLRTAARSEARADLLRGAAIVVPSPEGLARLRDEAAAAGCALVEPHGVQEQPELAAAAVLRFAEDAEARRARRRQAAGRRRDVELRGGRGPARAPVPRGARAEAICATTPPSRSRTATGSWWTCTCTRAGRTTARSSRRRRRPRRVRGARRDRGDGPQRLLGPGKRSRSRRIAT